MIDPRTLAANEVRITEPGFYRMPASTYHADPCPTPSLSSSIAKVLLDKSPRHAFIKHPRLCPDFEEADETKFDFGSVAHELILGHGAGIMEVEADSWRTKAAQTTRDDILASGGQPILTKDLERANEMHRSCREQLLEAQIGHVFRDTSRSEVVMCWQDEGGMWMRAMLDWHEADPIGLTIYDLKTTGNGAHPSALGFKIADMGYEVQAGFYERGLATLLPELQGRITWRWVFQEDKPPFAVSVCELDGAGRIIGAKKAAAAIAIWRRCMETGQWPRWPVGIHRVEYPIRSEQAWIEREMNDPQLQALTINTLAPIQAGGAGLDMLKEIAP